MCHKLYTCVLLENRIQQELLFAQENLLERTTPAELRFSYYLRVCCSLMQELESLGTCSQPHKPKHTHYSEVMKSLVAYNPTWWEQCYVNETGLLTSDDPVIGRFLKPVEEFYGLVRVAIAPHHPTLLGIWQTKPLAQLSHRFS